MEGEEEGGREGKEGEGWWEGKEKWWEGGREEVMVVYRWNEGKGYNILGYKS